MKHPLAQKIQGLPGPVGSALFHKKTWWLFQVDGVPTVFHRRRIKAKKDKEGKIIEPASSVIDNLGPADRFEGMMRGSFDLCIREFRSLVTGAPPIGAQPSAPG